jgi:hypothetical protein
VLPGAVTGQLPGTLAGICPGGKTGMACFLPSWYKFYCIQARLPRASEASDGGRGTRLVSGRELLQVQKVDRLALVQCRGTNYFGTRNLSRCRILIACSCGNPGVGFSTGLGK